MQKDRYGGWNKSSVLPAKTEPPTLHSCWSAPSAVAENGRGRPAAMEGMVVAMVIAVAMMMMMMMMMISITELAVESVRVTTILLYLSIPIQMRTIARK